MEFQRLINEMRMVSRANKLPEKIYEEAINRHYAYNNNLMLEQECEDSDKEFVINCIKNDDYEVDNFEKFCSELNSSSRGSFLTKYSPEYFITHNVHCYSVPGYEIGFALKPSGDDVDIISVHNNSCVRGIGDELIESAKRLGGTILDHFDGFLTDFYQGHGFDEYDRYQWHDKYAPDDWDYETYGRPDVIMRRLKKD